MNPFTCSFGKLRHLNPSLRPDSESDCLLLPHLMAQNIAPQVYLSLLSGRYGDVAHLSAEHRDNEVRSRLSASDHPFRKDPDRLLDVLDSLAAICVRNDKGDVFFVSLAMDTNSATLHVSTNGTVPSTLITHLHKIRGQLRHLKSVVEPGPSTSADIDSPDPNNTQARTDCELKLQQTIYEYSYKKLQRRFTKRGVAILDRYDDIMKGLEAKNRPEDTKRLSMTRMLLRDIEGALKNANPQERHLTLLIKTIFGMNAAWRKFLKATDANVLTRWDDLTRESGLASRIYDANSSLIFSCQEKQKFVSAAVSPEVIHPSPPHTIHIAHRMV